MGLWSKIKQSAQGFWGATPTGCSEETHRKAVALRQGSPQFEHFIATAELEPGGNLTHGMKHLGNLLSFAPGRADWLELLEAYLERGGNNPASLLGQDEKNYFTAEAVRAYIFHRQGRLRDAIDLLVAVTRAKQDARYLEEWGLKWLERPGAFESLERDAALMVLGSGLTRFPEYSTLSRISQKYVLDYVKLSERFNRAFPGDAMSEMMRIGVLRKAGLFDEALAATHEAQRRFPSWHMSTAEGLIRRAQGDCEGAAAAFAKASEFDPSDVTSYLEMGDMYLNRREWAKSQAVYDDVLRREPQHPWALPSSLFCQWQVAGDDTAPPDAFLALLNGTEPNHRAQQLLDRYRPYVGYLPEPSDATANVLRQIIESADSDPNHAPSGEFKITVSSLEAPSNLLAFRLQMAALNKDCQLAMTVANVPRPDPRKPIGPVDYLLWIYHGTDPSPGLAPPSPEVVDVTASIAVDHYEPGQNWAKASRVAQRLGTSRAGDVLALMVHPPPLPEGRTALEWIPRVQLAAAQVLAHIDGGWEGSVRRSALLSALWGPMDWTTTAAIVALTQLAADDEVVAYEVHAAFERLAASRPEGAYVCYEHALFSNWQMLPILLDREREQIRAVLKRLESNE